MEPKPAAPAQPTETAEQQQIAEPVTERVMQQLSEEEEVDVPTCAKSDNPRMVPAFDPWPRGPEYTQYSQVGSG